MTSIRKIRLRNKRAEPYLVRLRRAARIMVNSRRPVLVPEPDDARVIGFPGVSASVLATDCSKIVFLTEESFEQFRNHLVLNELVKKLREFAELNDTPIITPEGPR